MILRTDRLHLHELSPAEAQDLLDLNNDPEVIKYTGDPPFENLAAAEGFVRNYQSYVKTGMGRWAVRRNNEQR